MEKQNFNSIKVSVIIPVYNVEKYIKRCLESVLAQELAEIEIIIINDGSNDNSAKIISEFLNDKRIIYIEQKNKGQASARNTGFKLARGQYISFIDSDDYIDLDFLLKLYNAAEKNNADIAAASIVRKHETFEKWRVHYDTNYVSSDTNEIFKLAKYPDQSYVWNKIYKKSFLESINYKLQDGKFYEDILATMYALFYCKRMVFVANTNYYYMVNDRTSIVKGKKTLKKEKDRYNNQKEAIKFCIQNKINLPKTEYFIKKAEYKILNIPILKIKENLLEKKEIFLLFNVIPVLYAKRNILLDIRLFFKKLFSIKKVDNHILIMFFSVKISIKLKPKSVNLPEINTPCISKIKRTPQIVASLTSFPDRITTVEKTIKTIMNQTVKPDRIVLYLAYEQFENREKSLPSSLLELKKYGLEIKWCNDIKSYKKLVPALLEFKDDIIITFDDDIYYPENIIETLYNSYLEHPNEIQSNRIWRLELNKKGEVKPLHSSFLLWNYKEYKEASFKNTIIGCGGVLYPPNSLHKDAADESKFMKILPTQDDIWFFAMAVLNGTKIRENLGYDFEILTVENSQNCGLSKINNKKKKGVSGQNGFNLICTEYPAIKEIIKNEM